MVDFRTMLSALVAAYDQHRKWMMADKFAALQRAVDHARAVLAQPEPAPAADGEVAELVALLRHEAAEDEECDHTHWLTPFDMRRAVDLLERQVLRPILVSERLPEPKDCNAEGRCWWGDAGDDQFVPSWRLCEQPDDTHFTHWLPAHVLPLPEFDHE